MVLLQLTPQNSQIGAPLSPSKQPVIVSSNGLSSAGSALVESSNCKIFCSQQGHCDRYIVCHIPGAGQNGSAVHSTPSRRLSAQLVHCYCLINTLQLHSRIKVKAPPKPLQAERFSNSDIWLLA